MNARVVVLASPSKYGYCGITDAHCLVSNGCQSGCTGTSSTDEETADEPGLPQASTAVREDGRCGRAFGGATCDPEGSYGGCCSQQGCVLWYLVIKSLTKAGTVAKRKNIARSRKDAKAAVLMRHHQQSKGPHQQFRALKLLL